MAGYAIKTDRAQLYIKEGTTLPADFTAATTATTGLFIAANKIAHVVSMGDIASTVEDVDTTCLDSLAKENDTGFTDYGTTSYDINLTDSDTIMQMEDWANAGTSLIIGVVNMKDASVPISETNCIILDAGLAKITGVTKGGASVGGVMKFTVTIKWSGATKSYITP